MAVVVILGSVETDYGEMSCLYIHHRGRPLKGLYGIAKGLLEGLLVSGSLEKQMEDITWFE